MYYILVRKDTNRAWAISRKPFGIIPDHSYQDRTNESPLKIDRPEDKAPSWDDKAKQTIRGKSFSTRLHIMRAQQ
jgi:hypothetical protein